jgi:hypothetical protein
MSKENISEEELFEKYKFNYLFHGKAISEFSTDLNILLRKFLIKKIYELSQSSSSKVKKKSEDFLNSICGIVKAKTISQTFNADKLCKYEDFISFIEKSFEAAEEDFNNKIIQNDFSNYLQLIAVYRLIGDISELIDCWKEKDEKIQKFQILCKYRCIQIMTAKKDFETKPKTGIEKEIEELSNDIKNEKKKEVNELNDTQICKQLLGDINIVNSTIINPNSSQNDFNIFKKKLTLSVNAGNNNQMLPKINTYNLNIKTNEQSSNNKNISVDNGKNNNNTPIGTNYIDNKKNNPYAKLIQNFGNSIEQQKINNNQFEQYNKNAQKTNNYNMAFGNFNQHQNLLAFNNNNNINNHQNNQKIDPALIPYKQQVQQQYNNNYSYRYTPSIKNSSILPQRKIIVKKQDKEKEEIEKMLNELKGNSQKTIINTNLNKGINNNNIKYNNKNNTNNPNFNPSNQNNQTINKQNEQLKPVITENQIQEKYEFKQQTSNLLDDFKYKKDKNLDVELPVVYRGVDYIYLLSYIKEKKIPETITNIEKNNFEKALIESENILYYLTNIIPKDN